MEKSAGEREKLNFINTRQLDPYESSFYRYGFVRTTAHMMKHASIRSILISPVTLTSIYAIISHEVKRFVISHLVKNDFGSAATEPLSLINPVSRDPYGFWP